MQRFEPAKREDRPRQTIRNTYQWQERFGSRPSRVQRGRERATLPPCFFAGESV